MTSDHFSFPVPGFIKNVLFGSVDLQVIPGGYNSDVILVSHSQGIIVKVIGSKKGIILTLDSAAILGQQIAKYRLLLQRAKVTVPKFLDWAITEEEHEGVHRVFLFIAEPYCGVSAEQFCKQSRAHVCEETTVKILRVIAPLFYGLNGNYLPVGFDSKTGNFVIDEQDVCTYIDFMPPRFRTEQGVYLVEFPQLKNEQDIALWKWRYFTPQGILLTALYQLGRIRPACFQEIKKSAITWLRAHGLAELVEFFGFLDRIDRQTISETRNPYELRLLMCEVASRRQAPPSVVESFFLQTHAEGELSPELLQAARAQLINLI
jgi:hypothetical protein